MLKPSIVNVIGEYVSLRKAGKEYVALCPFHPDKHPSLSVSQEKGLFHCFACGESGDAITFIIKIEGVSFREACKMLGIDRRASLRPSRKQRDAQEAARMVHDWRMQMSMKLRDTLRDLGDDERWARELGWAEGVETAQRQWDIVATWDDDLWNVQTCLELYANRANLERIVNDLAF
jgi:DNA primase